MTMRLTSKRIEKVSKRYYEQSVANDHLNIPLTWNELKEDQPETAKSYTESISRAINSIKADIPEILEDAKKHYGDIHIPTTVLIKAAQAFYESPTGLTSWNKLSDTRIKNSYITHMEYALYALLTDLSFK